MKKLLFGLLVLAAIQVSSAFAVTVSSLYQAELQVASQAQDTRQQAVAQGLLQVLVKLSGDPAIAFNPVIRDSLKKSEYYVQEYSYAAPTPESSSYIINIRYDADDIGRLLKKAGVAWWGESRPLLLVWVAANNQRNAEVIGSDSQGPVFNAMKQQGTKYGIPVIFPIMDVSEITSVTAADINSMSVPVLKEAAKKYAPDALLIGSINKTGQGVESKWRLVLDANEWSWTISGRNADSVISDLMKQVSQTLAKTYSVKTSGMDEQWLKLQVNNITQRDDLAELMDYLRQMAMVGQIDLNQISGDTVEVSVQVSGSLEAFQKNAAIGQRLVLKSQDNAANSLVYIWVH